MSLPRIVLSLVLTVALSAAPVVQALAMAATSAPHAASLHASHADKSQYQNDHDAASVLGHLQHNNTCEKHDSCNDSCCVSCVHCFTGMSLLPLPSDVIRPVLTPSVYRLSFSTPIALRDRPPRVLSR